MQLPFANLLGLASGAMGLVSKVFTHGGGKGTFDATLKEALTGESATGKEDLMKMISEKGILDTDVLESLMGSPTGTVLFQFMSELKEIGLDPEDMGFLLSGEADKISDDAISKLLASSGLDAARVGQIMNDQNMKMQVTASLAESFKTAVGMQAGRDGIDCETLVRLATADAGTVEGLVAAGQPGNNVASSQTAAGIRGMIEKALKISGDTASSSASSGKVSPEGQVENMTSTAEKTFDIRRSTLMELFFSTDKAVREEAVTQVTRQVNAYLAAQGSTPLSDEVIETLAFIKSAMSEKEFSGIENSLKLWKSDLVLPDARASMDRNMYAALAKQLGSGESSTLYENQMRQVMDQVRRFLPAHIKNSEGSITLRLNPPMLGRVEVNMSMNDGQLQAAFKTDQAVTRDILLQNMHVLRETLAEQGIRATNFTVTSGLDARTASDGQAFDGQERQGHGFGRNHRRLRASERAFSDEGDFVYTRAAHRGASSGLDIIA